MDIQVNNQKITIDDNSFSQVPLWWVFSLEGEDLKRLVILHWRYSFFLSLAKSSGQPFDERKVFYESQGTLCELLGYSAKSRARVNEFISRMESGGYISVIRESAIVNGKKKSINYMQVNKTRRYHD